MREYSNIVVHNKYNNIGVLEKQEYEWQGDSPFLLVDKRIIGSLGHKTAPKELALGQYKLALVDDAPWSQFAEYVRKDSLYFYKFFILKNRLAKIIDLIYRRFIITLAVWNLANFQNGAIPTWRDIKIFNVKR